MTVVLGKVRRGARFLARYGPTSFAAEAAHRCIERFHERRLGICTSKRIRLADIGVERVDSRDSTPIEYAAFFSALRAAAPQPTGMVFLDYGVGTGRAVCAAATFPFRRIIGMDLSETLVLAARANVGRMRHRRAQQIDLEVADATSFAIPPDVNFIYFFNPFAGDTLRAVTTNIMRSLATHPRRIVILYFNNDHFDGIIGDNPPWITKVLQMQFYPRISCGVYESRNVPVDMPRVASS